MAAPRELPAVPQQLLPREAYIDDAWFERERNELFAHTWSFAGVTYDWKEPGDFKTVQVGAYPLVVLRDKQGELRAFHNLCRHRGTELFEGCGNTGRSIVCPYHTWTYELDGTFRGMPKEKICFPDIDKTKLNLKPASLGVFKGLVFVHPSADPDESFDTWLADLPDHAWPHDVTSPALYESGADVVYEMKCNWKVFFENAIDGYHLAYLHKNTLGGPVADKNLWEVRGRHLVWYSTEQDGTKNRLPKMVEDNYADYNGTRVEGAEKPGYGGVYMLFPDIVITASPYSFSISTLEPVDANTTLLKLRMWSAKKWSRAKDRAKDIPGYDPESGRIKSSHWTVHPLETGDFQTEDVWVCEKMQRSLRSPAHQVNQLARGAGGEASLTFFQQCVLDHMPLDSLPVAAQ